MAESVSGLALTQRISTASKLFTKLLGDGRVSITLDVPVTGGWRKYNAVVSRETSDAIVELFDPDGSIRARSLPSAELCLYKH